MSLVTRCMLFLLLPLVGSAQTRVDMLVDELEFLSKGSINNWKYSTSFAGLPQQPGFDDSRWDNLTLNQHITPDSCWIRKEIVLPEQILGQPIRGTVKILVSVDDYGYIYVDGLPKGYFPWNGEFILTENARPLQRITVAIKAHNTGGPLRLIRAQIQSDVSTPLRTIIDDFSLSLRIAQKLLSFDTYQTNATRKVDPGVDRSTLDPKDRRRLNELLQSLAATVRVGALKSGAVDEFAASLDAARKELKPIDAFAKQFTLYFDANAHIDAAWLWREKETIEVCRNTFSSVFRMMDQRPDFTYTQSSAAYYDWMERLFPEIFAKMRQLVRDGRWEIVGGMWVEPDCNIPSGESWARHLLLAKRYFLKKFGVDVKIGWNPDSFGYHWNMPMFYVNAGIDQFVTQKIGWNETNVFPHRVFWWESPDGSRILSYFPFDYVNTIEDPFRLADWLRQFEANTGFRKMMVLFGVGDHGGGPSLEMLQRIDRLGSLDIFPAIEHGTSGAYFTWLKGKDLSTLPTWNDELYLEYHQGTFTTQARMKRENRELEALLTNAEKFGCVASLATGARPRGEALEEAWKLVLFNQFHDILPGSSIRENYIDAGEKYDEARIIGTHELNSSLQSIAAHINTSHVKKGTPIVVFNPLAWERTDLVRVRLPAGEEGERAVFDLAGKEIPSQIVTTGRYEREVIFLARAIPSLGYEVFELRRRAPTSPSSTLRTSPWSIENQNFLVTVDSASGWVRSITDRRTSAQILSGDGNELQILEDKPSAWDAWNIGLTGVRFPSRFRGAQIVEKGPVRAVLRLQRDYLKPGTKKDFPTEDFPSTFFTQDIILTEGLDRIEFVTEVDWWEDKTMLKVAFPLAVSDTAATYEIPYGTIRRSTLLRNSWEKAQAEVPAHRWADVSSNANGVSLLNKSKYGYDIKGNLLRLSLLRSPRWPDPTADRGKHAIEYALYPHTGTWREAGTVRRGYEYNVPLIAAVTSSHAGPLPASNSFVRLSPAGLVLASLKKAEDSDAWVVQWYDAIGEDSEAVLELPARPAKVVRCDFLEGDGAPLAADGRRVRVTTRKHSVTTLKVSF